MFRKWAFILVVLQIAFATSILAQNPKLPDVEVKTPDKVKVDLSKIGTKGAKPPGFFKDFLELIKKHSVKKPTKQDLRDSIAKLNTINAILDSLLRKLSPLPPQKLVEFSLHAIEEAKYLSLYDSKNYYRSEMQWADYIGLSDEAAEVPLLKRENRSKCLYGFHPFWMGLSYYQYNFEIYDRVAYYGFSVDPASGLSATQYSAHSFATSQIVKKANERSGGKCKIDLCVESYGIKNNRRLFDEANAELKTERLTDLVVDLVVKANGGGICIDIQQVDTKDSLRFLNMVRMFREKFEKASPNTYQISMVLPSFSEFFPYTMSQTNLAELNRYIDRFIVMGYSSYSGIYNPAKDTLAAPITHDVLWNVLLVDDGINHYASLMKTMSDTLMTSERFMAQKMLLSIPANEIRVLKADSVQTVRYSDLKLLGLDNGFLKSFNEKLTYATLKNLKGVALWATGYDNATGVKDIHSLLTTYLNGNLKKDEDLLAAMQNLINENKSLEMSLAEFFPISDSLSDVSVPLPDALKIGLPTPSAYTYTTVFEKELIIIQHIVVLCLIIFLFFGCIGIVIALFVDSVREAYFNRENVIFFITFFLLIALCILIKNLNIITNSVFLLIIGIMFGSLIPFFIRKRQRKSKEDDRP
jgi:hypothetical protein